MKLYYYGRTGEQILRDNSNSAPADPRRILPMNLIESKEGRGEDKRERICVYHVEFQGFGDNKNGAVQWLLEKQI